MKASLVSLFIIISFSCFSQVFPMKDGKVFYEKIDTAQGSKNELFRKAKIWFANTFHDSKSVIQVDDKENGQLIGKGVFEAPLKMLGMSVAQPVYFTVRTDLKDNKYRIQLYDFEIPVSATERAPLERYTEKKSGRKMNESINDSIIKVLASYTDALRTNDNTDF